MPLFPFWLVNLAAAVLGVPPATYVLGTFIGIIPGASCSPASAPASAASSTAARSSPPASVLTPQIVIALVGLALLALLPVVYRKLKARPARA